MAPDVPAEIRRRPVGVFDSGVGGLTVLHELLVQLPAEDFVYLADSARFPYGGRSAAELEAFALEVAEALIARRVKLLVVACNSATAAALPALRERLMQTEGEHGSVRRRAGESVSRRQEPPVRIDDAGHRLTSRAAPGIHDPVPSAPPPITDPHSTLGVDVLGVVQPGAVQAVAATRNGRVGLLATPATVESGAYDQAIRAADPFVELTAVACPDLAAIIEAGFPFDEHVVETVRAYCAPLREAGVDTVVLGCTHYPLVRPMLQRMLGRGVGIIVSGDPLAHQVEHVLGARGLANPRGDAAGGGAGAAAGGARGAAGGGAAATEGEYSFLCTGDTEAFRSLGTRFLQLPLGAVEHVAIGGRELVGGARG